MPWCPRCDEVFPEGPACPRCRAALVDVSGVRQAEEQPPVVLPSLRVPRRLRRSFQARPAPPPPRHLIAVALSLVLVAGGFMLGRMSAVPGDAPALRPPPSPGLRLPVRGSLTYLRPGPLAAEYSLVSALLHAGSVQLSGRFPSPSQARSKLPEVARLSGLRGSVAVVVSHGEGRSSVAAFPAAAASVLWLDGVEAAWESADSLLVREGSRVTRWRFGEGPAAEPVDGSWRHVVQTPDGAVLEGVTQDGVALHLSRPEGPVRVLDLPPGASTVAVAPAGVPAVVAVNDVPNVWDGSALRPLDVDGTFRARGAAFSRDGARIAVVLQQRGRSARTAEQQLAVLGRDGGRVELLPMPSASSTPPCESAPAFNDDGTWVFVAPGDRSVQAVEVGGRRQQADAQVVGCGVVWSGDGRNAGV